MANKLCLQVLEICAIKVIGHYHNAVQQSQSIIREEGAPYIYILKSLIIIQQPTELSEKANISLS